MASAQTQAFYELQGKLTELNSNIRELCSKIWRDILRRSSRETVVLLKAKVEQRGNLTKLEELDRTLTEFIDLVGQSDRNNANNIEEYKREVEALKRENRRLKVELRRAQEQSEALDRLNESLGGQGLPDTVNFGALNFDFSESDKTDQQIVALQEELGNVRQQLSFSLARYKRIKRDRESMAVQQTAAAGGDSELLRRVQGLVPVFSGEASPSLVSEVYKFIDGINLVFERITEATQKASCLKMVKQRLQGDAYNLVRLTDFADEKDLIKLIKNTYLKTRSLDSINMEIWSAAQRPDEDIRQYARRLQNLYNTARAIIAENYSGATDEVIIRELTRKLRVAFISGLSDRVVGSSLLHSPVTSLEGLLEEALLAQSTMWRGEEQPPARVSFVDQVSPKEPDQMSTLIAAIQQLATTSSNRDRQRGYSSDRSESGRREENSKQVLSCAFCDRRGHTWDECRERRNTPYCELCGKYGHERRASCVQGESRPAQGAYRNTRSNNREIGFTNRNGQGMARSREYQNPFRRDNNRYGDRDRSVDRGVQRYTEVGRSQSIKKESQPREQANRESSGSQARAAYNRGSRTKQIQCFSCGVMGHMRAECPQNRQSENRWNLQRPQ